MKEKKSFTAYLQKKGLTQNTQNAYLFLLSKFTNWYNNDVINCTKAEILKYLEHLKKNKKQQNITRRNSLISLSHYFDYLRENGQLTVNPTNLIKIRGTKKKQLSAIFTSEELAQLADDYYNVYIRTYDNNHIPKNQRTKASLSKNRNYCILTFLLYQGLHTNEIESISLNDIDLMKATVKIHGKKKSNERILSLKAEQIGVLMNYIKNVRELFLEYSQNENDNLFLPLPEVSKQSTEQVKLKSIFKPIVQQIKSINQNFIDFNQIRASVITHWIKTEGLRKAQYMAGHRYISTTERYLSNDLEQLTDDIEKFNPFIF